MRQAKLNDVMSIADEHGLYPRERAALRTYLQGGQTCAEYDVLSPVVKAVVNAFTRKT
jgi:hypothetical protein